MALSLFMRRNLWRGTLSLQRAFFHAAVTAPYCHVTRRQIVRLPTTVARWHYANFHTSPACVGQLIQFKLSDIGEGIREVTLKEWHIKVGDHVNQFDSICEVQSDKASVTITSRYDGIIRKLYHKVDDTALVGQPLVDIEMEASANKQEEVDSDSSSSSSGDDDLDLEAKEKSSSSQPLSLAPILTTPAVRRIAKEHNVDLSRVKGTGRDGRILKEDIMSYVDHQKQQPATCSGKSSVPRGEERTPSASSPSSHLSVISKTAEDRVVPLTLIQKAMRKSMSVAKSIPHLTLSDEVNMTEMHRLRARLVEKGIKLSYMPFFIKAASLALKEFPMLNAYTDANCENLIYKSSHNIGFAMDTAQGLLVPNIKNVEQRDLLNLNEELRRLIELGTRGKLSQSDLTNGTFTLSNIGSIGGTYTRPVILPPEVIIGGIGRMVRVPKFVNSHSDAVISAHVVHVSWSADHRVIDGATVARFSNRWKTFLEQPEQMLLHTI